MMMFQITGNIGAPLCDGLGIVFCLLDTLPSFPANLAYKSTSPMITGFAPVVYAQQAWLGLHSLDLAHTPLPNSHRKAKDVLKEAILHSTGGNAATTVSTGLSASTSTPPKQTGQDAGELSREVITCHFSSSVIHTPFSYQAQMRQVSLSAPLARSGSSCSGRGSGSDRGSRRSSLSLSGSSGSSSGSGSGSGSHDGSPAWSQASEC